MEKRRGKIGIQGKLFLYLLAFSAILLVVLYLYQIVFLGRFYRYVKITEVRSSAAAIAQNIDDEDVEAYLEEIARSRQIGIEVITASGNVRYTGGPVQESILAIMSNLEKMRLLRQAEDNGGEIMVYFNRESFRESRQTGAVIRGRMAWLANPQQTNILYARLLPGEENAAILISSLVVPVGATVNTLRIQFYYIAGLMIILSVILAWLMARNIALPIKKINQRARTLAAGDYESSFPGGGYSEIDELAGTLNYAAGELSRVDHLRKELIANVSHDLRTPLTLIGGYAEAMSDLPGEASPENARIIAEETRRLTSLVNDMLDISRLESSQQPPRLQGYNLTQSIGETVHRLNLLVGKEEYTITFHYEQEAWVRADPERISQAFYNLLINAVHYTGKDKTVRVVQDVTASDVTIRVRDSGAGIAPEHLPYIWERYYKVDRDHRRPVAGTGLGLSIVRSIMEQHQAPFGVHSQQGQGSEFWFTLPREDPKNQPKGQ